MEVLAGASPHPAQCERSQSDTDDFNGQQCRKHCIRRLAERDRSQPGESNSTGHQHEQGETGANQGLRE